MKQEVFNGNNLELLKQYPDNYFDAIVTDPPYGLGKEPNAEQMLQAWINDGYLEVKGSGFMGKEWDAFVPQPIFWKEVFRTLKHGGHVVSFFGTRTYDWGVMAMRLAGFEVRDCINWVYGCLSDDTEILTRSGYIPYHKFKNLPKFEQEEICIYDIEKDIYKWEKPERWNEYNIHKDTAYRIESNSTDQIVSRNHRCIIEREGKLVFKQAEYLSKMEYMPTLSNNFLELQESEILQSSMQRTLSGSRVEETRTQGEGGLVGGNQREISVISNGREQSILERWDNLPKEERILFGSEVEVLEMPERVFSNGKEGWLCSRVSVGNGEAVGQTFIENGVCASHRPQSNEQRYNESNVICNEQGTQTIRVGRSYSTTLATITPIEYSGVIFCPTISTGSFVARRNGKIFITGNSGFPKSHNISKAIDKMYSAERQVVGLVKGMGKQNPEWNGTSKGRSENSLKEEYEKTNPSTDQAKEWEGWGSALKPAHEDIVLARKPLEKGLSIAENVLKWGTGGINIDGCRVSTNGETWQRDNNVEFRIENNIPPTKSMLSNGNGAFVNSNPKGRFPANFIMTHHPDCVCVGTKKVGNGKEGGYNYKGNNYQVERFVTNNSPEANSNYGEETIENWNCHEDCPIKIMDEQSGDRKGWASQNHNSFSPYGGNSFNTRETNRIGFHKGYDDKGGASRFFYCAKASKKERNKGLEGFEEKQKPDNYIMPKLTCSQCGSKRVDSNNKLVCGCNGQTHYEEQNSIESKNNLAGGNKNIHPTVKPISLMRYLVRLITPPNGIVLDPFNGSGTTGIACKLEGMNYVGMELDADYCKISQARIDNFTESDLKYEVEEQDDVEEVEKTNEVEKNNNQLGLF